MDETEPKPMTDADVVVPPGGVEFQPAEPMKGAGAGFEPASGSNLPVKTDGGESAPVGNVAKQAQDNVAKQAQDKAYAFVGQGKERAAGALEQVTKALNDAAAQVDEKVGEQYGQYARTAAGSVQQFAEQIRAKDPEELVDDARRLVRRSPGVAIGAAAALGFVVARLASAGIDQRNA